MEKIWIYTGSFDPITNGHLDIIKRASKLCDRLIVAVLINKSKTSLFSVEERVNMIQETTGNLGNVTTETFSGLTVDFAREKGANALVRGLRGVTDFEYEMQMSQTNKVLYNEIDTVFLCTDINYSYLSSSISKEIATFGGDIATFVPPYVERKVKEKLRVI